MVVRYLGTECGGFDPDKYPLYFVPLRDLVRRESGYRSSATIGYLGMFNASSPASQKKRSRETYPVRASDYPIQCFQFRTRFEERESLTKNVGPARVPQSFRGLNLVPPEPIGHHTGALALGYSLRTKVPLVGTTRCLELGTRELAPRRPETRLQYPQHRFLRQRQCSSPM